MARTWRVARALEKYRTEVDQRWPGRDTRSDGTIGDAAHAARSSDHNPWLTAHGIGVVRACDIDKDLTGRGTDGRPASQASDAAWLAEHLRALGRAGDPRLRGGGYVIWNRRIASEVQGWAWRPYTGRNSHEHHVHLSVSQNVAAFDSTIPWGIWPPISQEDDVLKDQTVTNPVSGKPETLDVTVAYMEQRIVSSILQQLPGAVARSVWDYAVVNPLSGAKESAATALGWLEQRITGRSAKKVS